MSATTPLLLLALLLFGLRVARRRAPNAMTSLSASGQRAAGGILYRYLAPSCGVLFGRIVDGVLRATPRLPSVQGRLRAAYSVHLHPLDFDALAQVGLPDLNQEAVTEVYTRAKEINLALPVSPMELHFRADAQVPRGFPRVIVGSPRQAGEADTAEITLNEAGPAWRTTAPTAPRRQPTRQATRRLRTSVVSMVHEGRVVELIEPVNVVGADPECDVVLLPRRDIDSWHHATILVGDEIEVRDGVDGSKSTNGVFVNKRRINGSAVVHEGDMIHFATINGPGWLVNETNG